MSEQEINAATAEEWVEVCSFLAVLTVEYTPTEVLWKLAGGRSLSEGGAQLLGEMLALALQERT